MSQTRTALVLRHLSWLLGYDHIAAILSENGEVELVSGIFLSWTRFHGTIMCEFNALEAQPVQTTIYLLCAHVHEKKKEPIPQRKTEEVQARG